MESRKQRQALVEDVWLCERCRTTSSPAVSESHVRPASSSCLGTWHRPASCREGSWQGTEGTGTGRPPSFGTALGQVELSGVGHVRSIGSSRCGPFVVSPSRETSESLLLENRRDRGRTQLFPTLIQGIPDVVHRRVLLAQGDDLPTKSLPGRRQLGLLRLWQKELSLRVFAELMAQDAKTPGCVAEPLGRLC